MRRMRGYWICLQKLHREYNRQRKIDANRADGVPMVLGGDTVAKLRTSFSFVGYIEMVSAEVKSERLRLTSLSYRRFSYRFKASG